MKPTVRRPPRTANPRKPPTVAQLRGLHDLVREYCRRERSGVDIGDPPMVKLWLAICRAVGVRA